jgi:trans-aconitate methyltransferase
MTYKIFSLKNLPHILRLRKIHAILSDKIVQRPHVYIDVGCSNGYITNLVAKLTNPKTVIGLDHCDTNLTKARNNFPSYQFEFVDLNQQIIKFRGADFIRRIQVRSATRFKD